MGPPSHATLSVPSLKACPLVQAEQRGSPGILEASKREAEKARKDAKLVLEASAEAKAAVEQDPATTKAALRAKEKEGERRITELQVCHTVLMSSLGLCLLFSFITTRGTALYLLCYAE